MPANPKVITTIGLSSTTGYDIFQPDYQVTPFNLGLGVTSTGNTYTVQHTFNDLGPMSTIAFSSNATWYDHSTLALQTSNAVGNYAFPVRGIRLNVTVGSSTGTVVLTIVSAG